MNVPWTVILSVGFLVFWGVLYIGLNRAPEGWEDDSGFHRGKPKNTRK